jgi:hypothetical protein
LSLMCRSTYICDRKSEGRTSFRFGELVA